MLPLLRLQHITGEPSLTSTRTIYVNSFPVGYHAVKDVIMEAIWFVRKFNEQRNK